MCAPVHDAFWILAPIDDVERTIEAMRSTWCGRRPVSGGLTITVSVAAKVLSPFNLGQTRGPRGRGAAMWSEVQDLLAGGLRRQTGT